ncbi:hypothetical protein FB45DRAFT_730216 [Roridomyces roridus]|uniref:Integrase core domain-containing protein n=1 Tax=Roridomyces roridus TaxID=1738132 RepID=A0AAD7G142_9AGAR|nr:hypothetical protein FB45DRAFT_730216 [Roridomyces roridus]
MADAPSASLLDAFRAHFHAYRSKVDEAMTNATDETVLSRLTDDMLYPSTSHHGRPTVIERVYTGRPGRPRYAIDPDFLQFAHEHRSTSGIGHFLGVSRGTVRSAILQQGLAEPQPAPFYDPHLEDADAGEDDILDPQHDIPPNLLPDIPTGTGHISEISDDDLDSLLLRLRTHFRRAGLSMLDGLLRRLGHRVPRERVRESLSRIDPVQRVFQRIRIRRREYSVAGPNALWHHDGQHGESIHNVRIERLWVDVTAQIGATWGNHFMLLELHHGLNVNNSHHIWLLHFLFLPTINDQLTLFVGAWNEHRIQMRRGPSRSPADLFGFDSLVHGVRGHALEAELTVKELEVYGVDWEALNNDSLLESNRTNNTNDTDTSSWVGQVGVPQHLNEVPVEAPSGPFGPADMAALEARIAPWRGLASNEAVVQARTYGLAVCRTINGNLF